ncbi:hypothetical protein LO767_03315 [Halopseudomonas aestusnigri]|uniref:hypothetical protein n=1 Tax=Halopseudomonas aestusnigri TaxID=857252 RepID=UPI001E2B15AC|nr:hypothetical protein [Halopseudomonas aestusnigri]UGV31549.1 hypothetical protein LO767_03315 [Halopseudomonas aestusnigri]
MHNNKETLQAAAAGFLQRHAGEHVGNDEGLFLRTVEHLQRVFGASQAEAENSTAQAMTDAHTGGVLANVAQAYISGLSQGMGASAQVHATANHLMASVLGITRQKAENAAAQAFAQRVHHSQVFADLSSSTSELVMLRDTRSGMTYAIPVEWIRQVMLPRRAPALHVVH